MSPHFSMLLLLLLALSPLHIYGAVCDTAAMQEKRYC